MNMNLPVVRSPLLQGDFFSLLFPQLCEINTKFFSRHFRVVIITHVQMWFIDLLIGNFRVGDQF